MAYDVVVLAPGCLNQTFGTPGVVKHACFVRNAEDARGIKGRVEGVFERASLPGVSEDRMRELLHVVIVGGGPTGVELAAEMCDLFEGHYARLYPGLRGKARISIHDVATRILSPFDEKLQDYALGSFKRRGVGVVTGSHILGVDEGGIETRESGRVPAGLVIWATGNRATRLVESLDVRLSGRGLPRILTDNFLRVLAPLGKDEDEEGGEEKGKYALGPTHPDAYALGDAADIVSASLPTTAEVACQKAEWLAKALNAGLSDGVEEPAKLGVKEFHYEQKAVVAYLGQHDGVVEGGGNGDEGWTGQRAWMAWRSKNFWWTRSWRQKALVVVSWLVDVVVGRG